MPTSAAKKTIRARVGRNRRIENARASALGQCARAGGIRCQVIQENAWIYRPGFFRQNGLHYDNVETFVIDLAEHAW
jgi:hypothetical protein